jgi:hypothetical protein
MWSTGRRGGEIRIRRHRLMNRYNGNWLYYAIWWEGKIVQDLLMFRLLGQYPCVATEQSKKEFTHNLVLVKIKHYAIAKIFFISKKILKHIS